MTHKTLTRKNSCHSRRTQAKQMSETQNCKVYFFRDEQSDKIVKVLGPDVGKVEQTAEVKCGANIGCAPSSPSSRESNHLRYLRFIWLFLKGSVMFPIQCMIRGLGCLFSCISGCLSCCFYEISRAFKFVWLLLKASVKFIVRWMLRGLRWLDKRIILDLDL